METNKILLIGVGLAGVGLLAWFVLGRKPGVVAGAQKGGGYSGEDIQEDFSGEDVPVDQGQGHQSLMGTYAGGNCRKCYPIRYDFVTVNILKFCSPRQGQTNGQLQSEVKEKIRHIKRNTNVYWKAKRGPYKGLKEREAIREYLDSLYRQNVYNGCADRNKTSCQEWW